MIDSADNSAGFRLQVDNAGLDAVEKRIKVINMSAEIQRTQKSQVSSLRCCIYVCLLFIQRTKCLSGIQRTQKSQAWTQVTYQLMLTMNTAFRGLSPLTKLGPGMLDICQEKLM